MNIYGFILKYQLVQEVAVLLGSSSVDARGREEVEFLQTRVPS